jgi:YVTN family beta-propeller protein
MTSLGTSYSASVLRWLVCAAIVVAAHPPALHAQRPSGTAPATELLWVSNEESRDVSVIRASDLTEVARIDVGERPRGIRASPDGRRIYVALSDEHPNVESGRDAVVAIDTRTRRIVARHPVGTDPEQFGLSPDGRRLYAANEDAGTASVTDLASGRLLATLIVGIEPEGVAVSHEVVATVELEGGTGKPVGVTVSPDGRRVYVANGAAHHVSVLDAASLGLVARIPVGRRPWGLTLSQDGRRLYTANGLTNDVSVIDTRTNRVVGRAAVGTRPWGLAVIR